MLQYCDMIAHFLRRCLVCIDDIQLVEPGNDPRSCLELVEWVKSDLHPTEGYLISTKKTIDVKMNSQRYRITVECLD